jgi:hypothetical protein
MLPDEVDTRYRTLLSHGSFSAEESRLPCNAGNFVKAEMLAFGEALR